MKAYAQVLNLVYQLAAIIFFIAFIQMMYYLGVMQWIIKSLYVALLIYSIPLIDFPTALGSSSRL